MFRNPFSPRPMGPVKYLIAGLGNPGGKYENTRHNAGFMAVDYLAGQHGASVSRLKFKGLCGEAEIGGQKVLLLKPSTYMNLSGQSVQEAMAFYKLPPENVIILFDDISLPPGRIRIRRKGSDGGHNGMKISSIWPAKIRSRASKSAWAQSRTPNGIWRIGCFPHFPPKR